MTLRIPDNRDQVYDKLSSDVQAGLPNSNPQKEQSWLKAILVGFAGAFYDLYLQILEAINTFFADTTYGIYLERKASNVGLSRKAATQAEGNLAFTGTVGTLIPSLTALTIESRQYQTQEAKSLTADSVNVDSLTYASGIATAVTDADHNFTVGMIVTIAGSTPTSLNGAQTVKSVTGTKTFTFVTTEAGSGTATGTITAASTKAIIKIKSVGTGVIQNLNANEILTLSTPIVGVDNTAKVVYDGVGGGADDETDESLRERLIYRLQNPVTLFNKTQITLKARELAFVKRVFVFEITPQIGSVTIYILKDNNEIPNASEITQAKDKIKEIKPANTSDVDLIVAAPAAKVINFTISALDPNAATMKTSITNSLKEYFKRKTEVAVGIKSEDYICVIKSTIDSENGDLVKDFTVDSPTGDITIAANEIGQLGTVTFV